MSCSLHLASASWNSGSRCGTRTHGVWTLGTPGGWWKCLTIAQMMWIRRRSGVQVGELETTVLRTSGEQRAAVVRRLRLAVTSRNGRRGTWLIHSLLRFPQRLRDAMFQTESVQRCTKLCNYGHERNNARGSDMASDARATGECQARHGPSQSLLSRCAREQERV